MIEDSGTLHHASQGPVPKKLSSVSLKDALALALGVFKKAVTYAG